jgi:hypothetical protein
MKRRTMIVVSRRKPSPPSGRKNRPLRPRRRVAIARGRSARRRATRGVELQAGFRKTRAPAAAGAAPRPSLRPLRPPRQESLRRRKCRPDAGWAPPLHRARLDAPRPCAASPRASAAAPAPRPARRDPAAPAPSRTVHDPRASAIKIGHVMSIMDWRQAEPHALGEDSSAARFV